MHEVSNVTKGELIEFQETYQILGDFRLYTPRSGNRVMYGPVGCLAMYEEDLRASLHFF